MRHLPLKTDVKREFFNLPDFPIQVTFLTPLERTRQDIQDHDHRTGVSPDLQNKRLILKADLLLDRWSRAGFHET
jgi:hypothetical protein